MIRYKANPDYWEGKAPIDNLVFAITPDASVRWQKLKAGECHVMPYPNPADIDGDKADPNIKLLEQEGLNVGYLAFNVRRRPSTSASAQGAEHGDQQAGDPRAVYQGAGVDRQEPDTAHDLVAIIRRSRTTPTILRPRRSYFFFFFFSSSSFLAASGS